MALADLVNWLDDHTGPSFVWYIKRLSGNDTLANGSHQAGPYIPRSFLFGMFPAINRTDIRNLDVRFDLYIRPPDTAPPFSAVSRPVRLDEGAIDGAALRRRRPPVPTA